MHKQSSKEILLEELLNFEKNSKAQVKKPQHNNDDSSLDSISVSAASNDNDDDSINQHLADLKPLTIQSFQSANNNSITTSNDILESLKLGTVITKHSSGRKPHKRFYTLSQDEQSIIEAPVAALNQVQSSEELAEEDNEVNENNKKKKRSSDGSKQQGSKKKNNNNNNNSTRFELKN